MAAAGGSRDKHADGVALHSAATGKSTKTNKDFPIRFGKGTLMQSADSEDDECEANCDKN